MTKYGSYGIKYSNTGFRKALVAPCVSRFRIPMYSRDRLHRWIKDHFGPYRVLDVKYNNVVIWKAGKRLTINVGQVRIYRHRKCDETEIGTGNSDNGSLRDESSGFDRVQRRSNDSRDGKKKGSEVKRELD
ncbi:uncharacterized protein TNCV_4975311 [Trichonephila clavipes]|uniref:Uncharacterized protein n=1 Tax=Trichonephila clavipes TaxID=2585209 RepID=A0A8X6SH09_TRICX|nr:uncharacterized protein TNCV_4975311 [Trichonephila clavipes]